MDGWEKAPGYGGNAPGSQASLYWKVLFWVIGVISCPFLLWGLHGLAMVWGFAVR